ncbi:MAG: peptide ABC transporter substrate-binding protein [Patescibacteria group bacterium]|nr:peptide ABC transporter substrate-binding protein [Patescibacteria group bacterium]
MNLINSSEKRIKFLKKRGRSNIFSRFFIYLFKRKKKNEIIKKDKDDDLDYNLVYALSPKKVPNFRQLKYAKKVLRPREKNIVNFFLIIILVFLIIFGIRFYKKHLIIEPDFGGEYIEGLVGSPKNINPLYSTARDVDSDISRLVFSSLFTHDKNGNIVNDLVEEYSISDNGLEYNIRIKEGVKWHHGESLLVDDIIFTFLAIKNPEYGSPLRGTFSGVEISKIDDFSFKFVLSESYAGFLEFLTFGILPHNLWESVLPQNAFLNELNIKPIGSGPYKLKSLTKNKSGEIKDFVLVSNEEYYGQIPYISKITLKFFNNYNELLGAINNNQVDGISYLPHGLKSELISQNSLSFNKLNLPQITSLFINEKKNSVLEKKEFRQALAILIDRNRICNEVFSGNASPAYGPMLPSSPAYNGDLAKYDYDYELAKNFLDESGWNLLELSQKELLLIQDIIELENNKNKVEAESKSETEDQSENEVKIEDEAGENASGETLNFDFSNLENKMTELKNVENWEVKKSLVKNFFNTGENLLGAWRFKKSNISGKDFDFLIINLSTVDSVDNIIVLDFIKSAWDKIGIRTFTKTISSNQVQSEIIKNKDFEVLLLSQVVGSDQDVYAFWHSSQISEMGLNISGYKNKEVDKLLDEARLSMNSEDRIQKYKKFQELLNNDFPVIFLYYPTYNYIQSKKIKGFDFSVILNPADRFNNASNWYINVNRKIKFRD